MHIVPKLRLRFDSACRVGVDGFLLPAWYADIRGMAITNPYLSDCGRFEVDPLAHYGMSPEQAVQLCTLNGVSKWPRSHAPSRPSAACRSRSPSRATSSAATGRARRS